ncbi:ABC transporter permease [Candidatus Desantisbacteria bacterium]|nr:ABC transporter permease [Candidatus Desantisbacteria bacterium]
MYFMRGMTTIWEREMIRYFRDKMRIFLTIFQPLMFLTIFGSGLKKTFSSGHLGVDSVQFMYPGIIAMSIMGVAFYSTVSTVWDREFGFLKEILVAPVSRTAIILGKALGSVSLAFFQALILLLIAPFIGITIHFNIIPFLFLFIFPLKRYPFMDEFTVKNKSSFL